MSDSPRDQEEQLKCLLADFNSIKTEIGRRSTLQRFVLVAHLAVLAVVFRQVAEFDHAGQGFEEPERQDRGRAAARNHKRHLAKREPVSGQACWRRLNCRG